LIIFGGFDGAQTLNDGGIYNPTFNTWRPITTNSAPAQKAHSAVWTGTQMLVWGPAGGFSYDPAGDFWSALPTTGAPSPGTNQTAVWTGTLMLVWTGAGNGARYNPTTQTWSPISSVNAPGPRVGHTAVWTGDQMIIWGGGVNTGARYFPSANVWAALP